MSPQSGILGPKPKPQTKIGIVVAVSECIGKPLKAKWMVSPGCNRSSTLQSLGYTLISHKAKAWAFEVLPHIQAASLATAGKCPGAHLGPAL